MKFNKILFVAITLFLFITSCEKELLENIDKEAETDLIANQSVEEPTETAEEVTERMRLKTIEFLELTGETVPRELLSETATASRATHHAFNYGRLSNGHPSFPNNNNDQLNFGTRTGTTQWVSFTLDNDFISNAQSSGGFGAGKLNINLNGVGQIVVHYLMSLTVSFNFAIDLITQTATVTPTSSAALHSRIIPNTSFTLDNPLSVTIHSNTAGFMWIEVKKAGTVVFSSLYNYTYNSSFDSRNGGHIYTSGFATSLIGPRPPYGSVGFTSRYSGYCGWF